MTLSDALAGVARIAALVLLGAGLAGIASLAGASSAALCLGVIGILVGGIFVGISNDVSWLPFLRHPGQPMPDSERSEIRSLFGRGYGVATILGLLGAGLVLGSKLPDPAAIVAAGVGGVAALAVAAILRPDSRDSRRH